MLASFIITIMDHINTSKYSPSQRYSPNYHDPTTVLPSNRRDPSLDGGHSTKIVGMWTLKHEIISPKFYELIVKTVIKRYTALDLKKLYNHIKMCLHAVTRLLEDLLPDYQSIKRHSGFEEYFIPYFDHPSYSWNVQIYTYLGH